MPTAEDGKVQEMIEQEHLRKLQLENDALERESSLAVDTPDRKRQKLDLEVQSLQWQNGLIYKLGQYATIITILATMGTIFATGLGVYIAYNNFKGDREHEAALKQKELADKTDSQYRTGFKERHWRQHPDSSIHNLYCGTVMPLAVATSSRRYPSACRPAC